MSGREVRPQEAQVLLRVLEAFEWWASLPSFVATGAGDEGLLQRLRILRGLRDRVRRGEDVGDGL